MLRANDLSSYLIRCLNMIYPCVSLDFLEMRIFAYDSLKTQFLVDGLFIKYNFVTRDLKLDRCFQP